MRRGQIIGLIVAAVLGLATAAAGALAADDPPHIQRAAAASGALALSNSREGAAIFAAHDLRPGDQISGTLTLGNTGDKAGRLLLSRVNLVESPGLGGGRLSDVLTLRVEDITSGAPADVVTGTLRGMQNVLLRDLPGGATRTYRFVVGFPDGGPGGADNAYQGGSVRMDYEWLTEAIAPAATPTPRPAPKPPVATPAPAPRGAAPAPRAQPRSAALAPRLSLLVPHQRVMHTAFVRVLARCSENCTVTFSGRAKTAVRGRRSRVRDEARAVPRRAQGARGQGRATRAGAAEAVQARARGAAADARHARAVSPWSSARRCAARAGRAGSRSGSCCTRR